MMVINERDFRPLPADLALEALVPRDNFYRRLEERLEELGEAAQPLVLGAAETPR